MSHWLLRSGMKTIASEIIASTSFWCWRSVQDMIEKNICPLNQVMNYSMSPSSMGGLDLIPFNIQSFMSPIRTKRRHSFRQSNSIAMPKPNFRNRSFNPHA